MGPVSQPQKWEHLGRVIRRWRRERGIRRQADLAAAVTREVGEISHKTIQNYEQGRTPKSAPEIPGGYYLVARFFGWPPGAVEHTLAGGQPEDLAEPTRPEATRVHDLAEGAFELLDAARDAGAPTDLVQRARASVTEVLGWLLQHARSRYTTAAYRPHAEGEGIDPDDAERIWRAADGDGEP